MIKLTRWGQSRWGKSAGCSVSGLSTKGGAIGGEGRPQHEVGAIIKSSFEHVEIEVFRPSQERWPIVISV